MRTGLNRVLDFSDADRGENIRRLAETSKLFVQAGIIVINAFITPTRALRALARGIVGADDFIEVHVEASWETCAWRDPKGLYAGAGGARCIVKEVRYKMDINTLHKLEGALEIGMNDIGRLRLRATAPLFLDGYKRNRTTGSLILIDEFTNNTVAAGMILEPGGAGMAEDAYADMGGLQVGPQSACPGAPADYGGGPCPPRKQDGRSGWRPCGRARCRRRWRR